jgi:hypothetical protein
MFDTYSTSPPVDCRISSAAFSNLSLLTEEFSLGAKLNESNILNNRQPSANNTGLDTVPKHCFGHTSADPASSTRAE